MPSPFPGMDPYLENPVLWRGVHDRLIPLIARAINDSLPAGYFADINERVYISEPMRSILPEVAVLRTQEPRGADGRITVLDRPAQADAPLQIVFGDAIRDPFVEIMTLSNQDRFVTTIEVLSPANKTPGVGREQYVAKQQQTFDSRTNLLEIDLLKQGTPTNRALADLIQNNAAYDYLVSLHRAGAGLAFDTWPFSLRDRMPRVTVPLLETDEDIILDLGLVFDQCYDDGPYARRVNYSEEPVPPVGAEDAAWVDDLLRRESIRS